MMRQRKQRTTSTMLRRTSLIPRPRKISLNTEIPKKLGTKMLQVMVMLVSRQSFGGSKVMCRECRKALLLSVNNISTCEQRDPEHDRH